MIVETTPNTFQYVRGDAAFTVAFLPEHIALLGTRGHQFFKNEKNSPPSELGRLFPSRDAAIERAVLHRVGTTNKERFLVGAGELLAERRITNADHARLREFIAKCDCAPPVIRQKLKRLGMGPVVERIEFEDLSPELESTVDAMLRFVENFHAKEKGAGR